MNKKLFRIIFKSKMIMLNRQLVQLMKKTKIKKIKNKKIKNKNKMNNNKNNKQNRITLPKFQQTKHRDLMMRKLTN